MSKPAPPVSIPFSPADADHVLPLPGGPAIEQHVGQLANGDPAVTAELIATMLDTNQSDVRNFRQACMDARWPDARASAHRIKSTAHLAGADSLAALSQRVETLARQGRGDAVLALAALYVQSVERLSQVLAACAGHGPARAGER